MTEEKGTGLYQTINKAIQDQECMLCCLLYTSDAADEL